MDKAEELLKALGLEVPAEDADIKVIVAEFREKQAEVFKTTPDFIKPLKDEAFKEGGIVAERKMKKALNAKFQLGLTNSIIDDTDFEAIVEQGASKVKGVVVEDAEKKDEKIHELTNQINALQEEKEKAVKENDQKWGSKYTGKILNQEAAKYYTEGEYILPLDELLEINHFKNSKVGYDFQLSENEEVIPMVNGLKANKPDNTGHDTYKDITLRNWEPYAKKSNGTGEARTFISEPSKEMSPTVKANVERMLKEQGAMS
jgi:hypothetical protein